MVVWKEVSKQATFGTSGHAVRHRSSASSAGGWCNGASSVNARSMSIITSSTSPARVLSPPCTMRCESASGGAPSSASSSEAGDTVAWPSTTSRSFNEVDPAFTVRIRTGSSLPTPARHLGDVFAVVPRPHARPKPGVDHLLAEISNAFPEHGYAVDHVEDEVVAIEVVEHHHVEWR